MDHLRQAVLLIYGSGAFGSSRLQNKIRDDLPAILSGKNESGKNF
ncbi:hypothetical protein [Lacrimispora sp. JR3]